MLLRPNLYQLSMCMRCCKKNIGDGVLLLYSLHGKCNLGALALCNFSLVLRLDHCPVIIIS